MKEKDSKTKEYRQQDKERKRNTAKHRKRVQIISLIVFFCGYGRSYLSYVAFYK